MSSAAWPLSSHHEHLVRELARVVALGGTWRLVNGPVVAARVEDYPEPWDESREALAKLIARTEWHAHLDIELVLEDARSPAPRRHAYLRETKLELVHADATKLELSMTSIGNDDVAGIVAHELGRGYVAQLPGDHPYRTSEDSLPDAATGSIATVAIGLGVVAANAAPHDRSAGERIGNTSYHQHHIDHAGGLDWQDLVFLLAVQASVRDDVLPALDTLRPSQAAELAAWLDVLDDHEAELVELLGLGDVLEAAPPRPVEPRAVEVRAAFSESDLVRSNLGRPVFRYSEGRGAAFGILGLLAGLLIGTAGIDILGRDVLVAIPMGLGAIAGYLFGRTRRLHRCATCRSYLTLTATECRICGGTIRGEIDHPDQRLEREEQLEAGE